MGYRRNSLGLVAAGAKALFFTMAVAALKRRSSTLLFELRPPALIVAVEDFILTRFAVRGRFFKSWDSASAQPVQFRL